MQLTSQQRREIRERFLNVDTANVADVLDEMGFLNQGLAPEFQQLSGTDRLAGWAFTIRGQMVPGPQGGDPKKMLACSEIKEDEISVWSGDGQGICYFGELIAIGMREKGSVGALIDGGIRDLLWLGKMNFPIFARYRTPVQSIGRWQVTGWQEPVFLAGATTKTVQVSPGDFILADLDGAIVIPAAQVEVVLAEAERLTQKEAEIRKELAAGLSLADALNKYGHV
ncbi:RraA family protein [Ottowia thiooxydans]|uniref:RraA family protein n=1 Tax=Ottowia thiooxydans TaxID=219182 RepID=UPI00040D5963|nr:RraA family protein [Ottowia thiooxydans]